MTDYDIHSCGYYCDRPACIVAQRNELRDKLFGEQWVKTYSGGKPNYTQPKEWVGLTDDEIDDIWAEFNDGYGIIEETLWGYERAIEAKLKEKNSTSKKNIQISDKND